MLQEELIAMGIPNPEVSKGGVRFFGHRRSVYRVNLCSGLATHVLLRFPKFEAQTFPELEKGFRKLRLEPLLKGESPVSLRVHAKKSKLIHSGAIEDRFRLFLEKRIPGIQILDSEPKDPMDPNGLFEAIQIRLFFDRVQVSVDSTGIPLHRRGWKKAVGKAPLREDLAHALILASGWDRGSPLVDPFAGSGTIPIEAAGIARKLAPGRLRHFSFEKGALFDSKDFGEEKRRADENSLGELPFRIYASDRDESVLAILKANAERAGVSQDLDFGNVTFEESAFLSGTPRPERGALVSNPPFGRRLQESKGLEQLYQSLGRKLKNLPLGFRIALLSADRRLTQRVGIPLESAFLVPFGGLRVRALVR
jgi:putative N6-adenine-specific DNA methylase